MWPATPSSKPKRENSRNEAARRSFLCWRSCAGLEKTGACGVRNGATRVAIISSAYRFFVKLPQTQGDEQPIDDQQRSDYDRRRDVWILRCECAAQALARIDQRIQQHQLLNDREAAQHA